MAEHAFYVNGKPTDYLRKAQREKREVTRRLAGSSVQFEVTPMIVVIADRDRIVIVIKSQPDGVAVVKRREITKWLTDQPNRLAPEDVERLAGDDLPRLRGVVPSDAPRPQVLVSQILMSSCELLPHNAQPTQPLRVRDRRACRAIYMRSSGTYGTLLSLNRIRAVAPS